MSAIVIGPSPIARDKVKAGDIGPADYMPFSVRLRVGDEINKAWVEYIAQTVGPANAEEFWRYLVARG